MEVSSWFIAILPSWLIGLLTGYLMATFLPFIRGRLKLQISTSGTDVTDLSLIAEPESKTTESKTPAPSDDNWLVSAKDLAFFQRHLGEGKDDSVITHTGGPWELMMQKEIPGLVRYVAWRRSLRNGSTEYKSITLSGGVTAKEFMDFYLDDGFRPRWDTMLHHTEIVENVDPLRRKQVVLWRRNFPFNFISEREYVIARCLFQEGNELYALTKSVGEDYEHPALEVEEHRKTVRIDSYYSMWRSRDVKNPWDGTAPACETVLLHHDDLKVPEHLARLTIKIGMWGFVKNIANQVQPFVQERRQRCGMYEDDAAAFGLRPLQLEDESSLNDATDVTTVTTPNSRRRTHKSHTSALDTTSKRDLALRRDSSGRRESGLKRVGSQEGWAKGVQRAGWTVVALTVVRLLLLNSGCQSDGRHSASPEYEEFHSRRMRERRATMGAGVSHSEDLGTGSEGLDW